MASQFFVGCVLVLPVICPLGAKNPRNPGRLTILPWTSEVRLVRDQNFTAGPLGMNHYHIVNVQTDIFRELTRALIIRFYRCVT